MGSEKKTAYAALDIGTSQMKLGVYCPDVSDKIILINSYANELMYGASGEVRADFKTIQEKYFRLFQELGRFLKEHSIEALVIGICGHVSSLLEWNKKRDNPVENSFPVWLDTSCYSSLAEYHAVMGNGRSKEIIGTFLPAGTNWLFTKLLHRKCAGFDEGNVFFQVSDAVLHSLTGSYTTHFSSQISMVDLRKQEYAHPLLNHLQLSGAALPTLAYEPLPLLSSVKESFHFPDESFVYPAMADLYTSLYALDLKDKEGFMLANTSEQAGAFYLDEPVTLTNFLHIAFDPGFINYGSTNTGANLVTWFVGNVLNKQITPDLLNVLTIKAANVKPEETPIILPYLQGERAPLWNSKLTASILELNSSHTDAHLFRAVLESIAFARRQCFEQLGIAEINTIKLGGGSSKNTHWNSIRATVLNKKVAVADEKELSLAGLINYMVERENNAVTKPVITFSETGPEKDLIAVYDEKYKRFIRYQNLLS